MAQWIAGYLAGLAVFLAADMTWLTLMGPRLYRPALGPLLADTPNIPTAVAFYLLYAVGIRVFAIEPALKSGHVLTALGLGALFGLVAYGVYDLTNQATLKIWSTRLSLVDMGWGAVLTGLAAAAGCLAAQRFGKG